MAAPNPDIATVLTSVQGRLGPAAQARTFYDGSQPDVYDAKKWARLFGPAVAQPRDNMCPLVVDTAVSRLRPIEFVGRTNQPLDTSAAKKANEIAKRIRFDQLAPTVHREGGKLSRAAVLVGVNGRGKAVAYAVKGDECHFEYDPESPGTVRYCGRVMTAGTAIRVNLHYPTYTERWISKKADRGTPLSELVKSFVPFTDDGRDWVLPNPMGRVPLFEFELDKSDLAPVLKLQPALDLALCDLMAMSRGAGSPQRYVTGAGVEDENAPKPAPGLGAFLPPLPDADVPTDPVDPSQTLAENWLGGKPGSDDVDGFTIESGPDQTWFLDDPQAKAGSLPAAELDGTIKLLDNIRMAVLRNTSTPPHLALLNSGDYPSGKALRTAEAQFVSKIISRQVAWGNVWEDLYAFAVQCELSHNNTGEFVALAEPTELELKWEDPYTQEGLTETERLDALITIGVPVSVILTDCLDYSPAEAADIEKRVKEAADAKAAADAAVYARGDFDTAV